MRKIKDYVSKLQVSRLFLQYVQYIHAITRLSLDDANPHIYTDTFLYFKDVLGCNNISSKVELLERYQQQRSSTKYVFF